MKACIACAAALVAASSASAGVVFGVDGVTANSLVSVAIGEAQLSVSVAGSGNTAIFTVANSGPSVSSVANVYFDDSALLSGGSVTNGPGTNFSSGGSPGNMPGGNMIGFNADFAFAAQNPKPTNGINPGEWVSFTFKIASGKTLADVLAAMNSGNLRVGMHVISFANGQSESFVTPAPGSLALLGLAGMVAGRRRR
jgi:hypothetical protein